ncbi:MAG: hypothetical protein EXR69_13070 [Myxococcales bacterium]|nr:hypothetical protein [Myxococcales bacterium]
MSLIWVLVHVACSAPEPTAAQKPPPAASAPLAQPRAHPDVVVIVLDTLRADRLTDYGYRLATSTGIHSFTEQSTRFESAYAPSSWTLPSTASLLTGQHPLRHQVRRSGDVLPASIDTLPERLTQAGWTALGFSHNVSISPRLGFDQGFRSLSVPDNDVLDYPHAKKMIAEINAAVATVSEAHPADPLFLYLQPMNCHGPYKVPKARRSTLLGHPPRAGFAYYQGPMRMVLAGNLGARTRVTQTYQRSLDEHYDTAVRYTLDQVGIFLDHLRAAGRYDNSLIVLTADHGEELFDHGGFSHGYSLHREVLHVPLFIKLPGQTEARVIDGNVSLNDILPTVLDAVGAPPNPADSPVDGVSLLAALRPERAPGAPEPPVRPDQTLIADINWKKRCVAQSIDDGSWKLIHVEHDYAGRRDVDHLYATDADPREAHDVAADHPDEVERLRALLASQTALLETGALPPENHQHQMNAEQLKALGYLE